jgi:hypothetical protein
VTDLGAARGVRGLTYDHSSVARWLAGQQPREPVPELIAEVLSAAVQRRVTVTELGMTPSVLDADTGLRLPASWPECVTAATSLWRADVERRRFLQDSALAASASSAVALQWLVAPRPPAPSGQGGRKIGASDVAALRHTAQTFREMDNRLGGGRVRGAVLQYLTADVTPMLAYGQFSATMGRRLAGAAAELAQLAGWMAYDTGLHGHAQRYLTLALSFARHAADDGLGAEILAAQAHQAVYLARPAEAVDLAAPRRSPRAGPGCPPSWPSAASWKPTATPLPTTRGPVPAHCRLRSPPSTRLSGTTTPAGCGTSTRPTWPPGWLTASATSANPATPSATPDGR